MEAAIVGSDTFGRVQSGIPTHRRPRQQLFRGCYGCYTRTANKLTPTPGSSSLVQSPRISGNHNLLTGKCIGNVQGVQTHILGQTAPHSAPTYKRCFNGFYGSGTRTLVHKGFRIAICTIYPLPPCTFLGLRPSYVVM